MLDVVTQRRSTTRSTRRATNAAAERLGRATSLALVLYCSTPPGCAKAEDGQGVAVGLPCSNAAEGCLPNDVAACTSSGDGRATCACSKGFVGDGVKKCEGDDASWFQQRTMSPPSTKGDDWIAVDNV